MFCAFLFHYILAAIPIWKLLSELNQLGEEIDVEFMRVIFLHCKNMEIYSDVVVGLLLDGLTAALDAIASKYTDEAFDNSNGTQEESTARDIRMRRSTVRRHASDALKTIQEANLTNPQLRGINRFISELPAKSARRIVPGSIEVAAQAQTQGENETHSGSGSSRVHNCRGDDSFRGDDTNTV